MTFAFDHQPARRAGLASLLLAAGLAACGTDTAASADAGRPDTAAAGSAADSAIVLDSAAQRLAGIELVTADTAAADQLVANGTITFDENRSAVVAPRAEGRVEALRADLGQRVTAGQTLALIASADVGQMRGEMASARARMEVAQRNYERERRLFDQQISSEKEMLEAEGEFRAGEADYNSALARLRSTGAAPGSGGTYALTSPISGVVVARSARPGQVVGPETELFTVADLSHLWITTDVYERDLARVRQGAAVTVVPRGLERDSFPGTVTYAGGEVENEGRRLRPGMYATVRIHTPPAEARRVVVPEIAVQEVDGRQVVLVAGARPGRYRLRPVEVDGPAADGRVAIRRGLDAGERVVAAGAFRLKAERMKASFGEEE